jgi:methylenetetrahydrofolate reductase (NADPH)
LKLIELIQKSSKPFYSLEFFPPKDAEQVPSFLQTAVKLKALNPLFASVTYGAGGGSQDNTVEISRRLKEECGFEPMPHLTCVGASRESITEFLERLRAIGVQNILALRGDPPKQAPGTGAANTAGAQYDWFGASFKHASDLVRLTRSCFPDFGMAVAGYPAPHPESDSFENDRGHIKTKLDAGADFVVTQLFFDPREYIDLVTRLRAMGVNKPIIPGVLPIQSFESLRHVLALCGANVPARLYIALEEANRQGGAEAVREAGLGFAVDQIRRLLDAGAPGIHLYTLNRSETCLRIAEAVGRL